MKDNPFFSIIIVTLNSGIGLVNSINSVLMQNFKNFEIIVKDGMSNDGSLNSIPQDSRVRLIAESDKGIYDAMNQALKLVSGQYVLFLNCNDFLFNADVLELYFKKISLNDYPILAYANYITTFGNTMHLSPRKLTDFFSFRNMLCHQVCFFKSEAYIKEGIFNTSYKVASDYDFFLRVYFSNYFSCIYINCTAIISESFGFSHLNNHISLLEVEQIRKNNFGRRYIYFRLMLSLTFPRFRNKISSNKFLMRYYVLTVNFINKYL